MTGAERGTSLGNGHDMSRITISFCRGWNGWTHRVGLIIVRKPVPSLRAYTQRFRAGAFTCRPFRGWNQVMPFVVFSQSSDLTYNT